jgi:sugar lactone lactonase YvrE
MRRTLGVVLLALLFIAAPPAFAVPFLSDTSVGTLELVVQDATNLIEPEGLAFDAFGNLFVTREETGSSGGVSYVNKTGTITNLVSGISRADGIILLPNGDLLVVSEVSPASTTNRLYRLKVNYGANNIPTSASATSLTTTVAINNPEGIDVLASSGAFGTAGTVFVSEDANPGRIFQEN